MGDYDKALEEYSKGQGETALYNQGNALAKSGKIEEAIAKYEEVLEQNPNHEDAKFNLEYLKQQQQQNQQQNQKQNKKIRTSSKRNLNRTKATAVTTNKKSSRRTTPNPTNLRTKIKIRTEPNRIILTKTTIQKLMQTVSRNRNDSKTLRTTTKIQPLIPN